MLITVKTFGGHNLNSSDYRTALLNPHGLPVAKSVYMERTNADSVDMGGYTLDAQSKVLSIKIVNYSNRHTLVGQLKSWFKPGSQAELVATFSDDDIDYQMTCRVISLVQDAGTGDFIVTLQTGESAWRAVTEDTVATWTVTADDTLAISVGGNAETYLSASLTAIGGPTSGYLYQKLYRLPNVAGVALGKIGWCIVVDTAALVTANKMRADCNDLRFVDLNTGRELNRWISGPNTTTTKVWVNLNLSQGFSLTSRTLVENSGLPVYLEFAINVNTQKYIAAMPKTGVVYHNNEWFAYNNTDAVNCRLTIDKRQLYNTPIETHNIGSVFAYIQYPLMMKYGNATAEAPSATNNDYDSEKPLINLTDSTNTSWVWGGTAALFSDLPQSESNRSCGWKYTQKSLWPVSYIYFGKQDTMPGETAMGMKAATYQDRYVTKAESVILTWQFYHAAEITYVSMTGDKWRGGSYWLSTAALRRAASNQSYVNLWTEATPSVVATWTAWTHNSVAVAAGSVYLQLIFSGGLPATGKSAVYLEALTCTVTFNSSNIPTGAFVDEDDAYPLVATLSNITDADYDDALGINYIMQINKSFKIDGELKTVYCDGVNAYSSVTPDDISRSALIRLKGGATNTIQITGDDLGELDIDLSFYRRRL